MPYETIIKEIGPVESKTLIKIFNKLDEKINMVDKLVTKIAVTYSCNCSSTMEIYNEIISLTKRKKLILDIQEIILISVDKLNIKEETIIKHLLKYPQIHICNLGELLNMGAQTLYRNLNNAYSHLSKNLRPFISKINQFFNKEKWAVDLYESIKQKNFKQEKLEDNL